MSALNLGWLNNFVGQLPETNILRKSIFTISGRWETVNSNLLAFFLDEKEEHNFSRLFFECLIQIFKEKMRDELPKNVTFDTEFTVEREYTTIEGNRIDILLKEYTGEESKADKSSWALIIENKLFAPLYNNLSDYKKSVNAINTYVIVLSINTSYLDFHRSEAQYINITHKELIEKVRENLSDYYEDSDDRHLLFLKDYFLFINSFYKDPSIMENIDETLKIFRSKQKEIETFKEEDWKLLKNISGILIAVMREFGFDESPQKESSESRHFYVDSGENIFDEGLKNDIQILQKFRFWINVSNLRYTELLIGYFELWDKDNTKYGTGLLDSLKEGIQFIEGIHLAKKGKDDGTYYHIYELKISTGSLSEGNGFEKQLRSVLETSLFKSDQKYIQNAVWNFKKLMQS